MPRHTLFSPDIPEAGGEIVIEGEEAKHATRVKRLGVGDIARLVDGAGTEALAELTHAKKSVTLTIRERRTVERVRPIVRVFASAPKGARLEKMVDALSQVGAASFAPLETRRGVVEPGENKMARAQRVSIESAKQSGRAWAMDIREMTTVSEALGSCQRAVLADESGDMYSPTGGAEIALLIGPEGGWTDEELERARDAGATVARFGMHTMRVEVAAPIACAGMIDQENRT